MTFDERVTQLDRILEVLSVISSTNEKKEYIDTIPAVLKDDFICIVEILSGKHKFGYKVGTYYEYFNHDFAFDNRDFKTIREAITYLKEPMLDKCLTTFNICKHLRAIRPWLSFFGSIIDRELKIGIGDSILERSSIAPMLAKKYEGKWLNSWSGLYVTEKLDGNRCIAFHDGKTWQFMSRSGKPMHVSFDMSGLSTNFIYDGEILSRQQVEMSECIAHSDFSKKFTDVFNSTSGEINRHNANKDLVYNIFDLQISATYYERRELLDSMKPTSNNVRIVPVLAKFEDSGKLKSAIDDILGNVTSIGGEGLMINIGDALYEHKRSNALLKYKLSHTIDMLVLDTYAGAGKYEGCVGGLTCQAVLPNGDVVNCSVGSGLSDLQRLQWIDKSKIVGKIVEVEYFSLSQEKLLKNSGYYSLRFPRLKKVRTDKNTVSIY